MWISSIFILAAAFLLTFLMAVRRCVLAEARRLRLTAKKRGWEELPLAQGQGQRPRVPRCIGTGAAERSYPSPKIRGSGQEELPHVRGQRRWPRRATPRLRSREAAKRSSPTSKEQWLWGCRRAERSYSTFKVRRGGSEEISLVQSKEQLHFAGAAVKRYPTSKVRETQLRQ